MQKPLRPCKKQGCAELVRDGSWCEKHKPEDVKSIRGESKAWRSGYASAWWRRTRAEKLLMDPFCGECIKQGLRTKATEVDHIKPHRGDIQIFRDKTNLQTLCHKCHSAKTMREQNQKRKS